MSRRALGASVGTAVAAGLALAATAPAAVYCVHQTGACGPGEIDQGASLQAALTAANGSLEDDQVKVRAEATPYSGPFTYAGAGGALQITGGGSGTILTAPMANGVTVLKVAGAASRVESLHIDVPLGNTTNLNTGLELAGTADGVSVLVPESPTGDTFGVQLTGGTFRNGSVLGPMPAAPLAFDLTAFSGSGTVLIEDSTVRMDEATDLFGGGTIRRVDAQGRVGFSLQSESTGGADGTFLIEDSLWRTQPGAMGTFQLGLFPACGTTSDLQVTARNLTLVNGTSEGSTASSICNVNARTASVSLASSIVLGGAASLRPPPPPVRPPRC